MTTKVTKWGNSLGIRIPKSLGIQENTEVDLKQTKNGLLIKPIKKYGETLDELLAKVTDTNRHKEINLGGPVGKEVW